MTITMTKTIILIMKIWMLRTTEILVERRQELSRESQREIEVQSSQ